jgi:hypothetical protein
MRRSATLPFAPLELRDQGLQMIGQCVAGSDVAAETFADGVTDRLAGRTVEMLYTALIGHVPHRFSSVLVAVE